MKRFASPEMKWIFVSAQDVLTASVAIPSSTAAITTLPGLSVPASSVSVAASTAAASTAAATTSAAASTAAATTSSAAATTSAAASSRGYGDNDISADNWQF